MSKQNTHQIPVNRYSHLRTKRASHVARASIITDCRRRCCRHLQDSPGCRSHNRTCPTAVRSANRDNRPGNSNSPRRVRKPRCRILSGRQDLRHSPGRRSRPSHRSHFRCHQSNSFPWREVLRNPQGRSRDLPSNRSCRRHRMMGGNRSGSCRCFRFPRKHRHHSRSRRPAHPYKTSPNRCSADRCIQRGSAHRLHRSRSGCSDCRIEPPGSRPDNWCSPHHQRPHKCRCRRIRNCR
jgi:hypothetical protein